MILCFDIGGSAMKGAVAASPTEIRPMPRVTTPARDFASFVAVFRDAILQLPGKPQCLAISITGVVDEDSGKLICANIPCVHQRDLKHDLEDALGLPVFIANDADCFALAEAGVGAGQGHRIVFGAILGSGVGGGLVVDGRLINEHGGFAGEWGHGTAAAFFAGTPPVHIPHFACECGQSGCVNTIGAARGMERLHQHLHCIQATSETIIQRWQAGDNTAARTLDVFVDLVSAPLALTINITGATIVPVGGGLANSKALLTVLDEAVRSRTLRRFPRPLVVPAACTVEPGLIGAALLGAACLG